MIGRKILDQMNGGTTTPTAAQPTAQKPAAEQFPGGKLAADQMSAIKKDAYVEGNKDAKITIIEYSDPECPFCIRQFNDKTVENALAAFPQANYIVKVVQ